MLFKKVFCKIFDVIRYFFVISYFYFFKKLQNSKLYALLFLKHLSISNQARIIHI